MKLKDRLLVLRRALITILNPKVKSVSISAQHEDGTVRVNHIYTTEQELHKALVNDMCTRLSVKINTDADLDRMVEAFRSVMQEHITKSRNP